MPGLRRLKEVEALTSRALTNRVFTGVWAMGSGKGGVGRSFLAANLGCVSARREYTTNVVDLDFGGGNLHTFLSHPEGSTGFRDILRTPADLDHLPTSGDIPGLRLITGVGPEGDVPSASDRRRFLHRLVGTGAHLHILDLEGGASQRALDFFLAAERPIVVIVPEPASVENAHRFVRRVYARTLEDRAKALGVSRPLFRREVLTRRPWKPPDLFERLEGIRPGLGETLQNQMRSFYLYLLVNQVRHYSDIEVGHALKNAIQGYFDIRMRFVGGVRHDPDAWLSVRRRRIRARENAADALVADLSLVLDNLDADRDVDPPTVPEDV